MLPPKPPSSSAPRHRPPESTAISSPPAPSAPAPATKPAKATKAHNKAAAKIQALVRGALLRGEWAKEDAAILIQTVYRGHQGRAKFSLMIEEMIARGDL